MEHTAGYHTRLKQLIIEYILLGYQIAKQFPSDERFGMTSQAKRALVSVLLNYVEGFARSRKAVMLNMYETSYGSLQESICVFFLACKLHYIKPKEYITLYQKKEEIAKMQWKTIEGLRTECQTKN